MKKITDNSKIKAVIFDLDHTLFDRYETLKLVAHDLYKEKRHWFNPDIPEERAAEIIIEADGKGITGGWAKVFEIWREHKLLALDDNNETVVDKKELFDFIWNYGFIHHAVKYPFTNPMLDELRAAGVKTGLITNASGGIGIERQNSKLRILEMEDRLNNIIITGQVGIHKPHRNVFDIMSWRLGIPAENMLYVGDHPVNDVLGSKRAGYIPVWVRIREEYGETADCKYSVKDVSEIPALVERINSGL